MSKIHQQLTLYTQGNDYYTFQPTDSLGAPSLSISRTTDEIILNPPNSRLPVGSKRSARRIYGILGLISLLSSEYIIIIIGREVRGRLLGHDVYRATEFELLPLSPYRSAESSNPVEAHLLALVNSHLNSGFFIFSYGYDLTKRLQAQYQSREDYRAKSLWELADDRFFWNKFLQERLMDASVKQDLGQFILPIVYGTFDIRPAFIHGRHMQLGLISRRSRYRAGTRYFRRGIDHDGHVANFNETEQLVLIEGPQTATQRSIDEFVTKFSFVQIRGSVPVFWAEINTLRYKPDLQIMDLQDTSNAMRLHLEEQRFLYGTQTLVNLVNQKGHEKPVKEAYERYVSELKMPDVRYEYFDFHNECKHMRWDRISVLIDRVQEDLIQQGYFHEESSETHPIKIQEGVVRTNCMDNLDRTNVVQASLARWTMNRQLQSVGILPSDSSIDNYESLSKDFREMWADHADLIAKAYGGSGALKSDFTRSNKRTKKGALEDGYKSVLRYLKNNYFDGGRQDAFDLVTGSWKPRKNGNAGFLITDNRPLLTRSMPAVAFFSLFMICAGLTLPRTSDYSLFYYFLMWFTFLSMSLTFILINGIDYVSWPQLNPLTDIIYYTGSGFRSAHNGKGLAKNKALPKWPKRYGAMDEIEMGTRKRVD